MRSSTFRVDVPAKQAVMIIPPASGRSGGAALAAPRRSFSSEASGSSPRRPGPGSTPLFDAPRSAYRSGRSTVPNGPHRASLRPPSQWGSAAHPAQSRTARPSSPTSRRQRQEGPQRRGDHSTGPSWAFCCAPERTRRGSSDGPLYDSSPQTGHVTGSSRRESSSNLADARSLPPAPTCMRH